MSIAFELSSDVAAAIFADSQSQSSVQKQDLTRIMLEFHRTLRRLTKESRQRRSLLVPPATNPVSSKAASSN